MLNLDIVKKYLNIDADYTDDDELLIKLINALDSASKSNANQVGQELTPEEEEQLDLVSLMNIATVYSNRESMGSTAADKTSPMLNYLLVPSMNFEGAF